jgi:hypothetical protein
MTPDLDALERLALAATKGPWTANLRFPLVASKGALIADLSSYLPSPKQLSEQAANAAYIAAASPSAVLALVREVRELRARCANLAGQLRTHPWREGDPT